MDVQDTTEMPCDVLPLDFVVGTEDEDPIGPMAKAVDVCPVVVTSGTPDDADPDDEAPPEW